MSVWLYIEKIYCIVRVKEFINKFQDTFYFATVAKIDSAMITKKKKRFKLRVKRSAS